MTITLIEDKIELQKPGHHACRRSAQNQTNNRTINHAYRDRSICVYIQRRIEMDQSLY
uniref:Uncharacterized protein n=1 Tax=Arundo donax TaxID=35708 RepID=A0A0A9BBV9_ARUDO